MALCPTLARPVHSDHNSQAVAHALAQWSPGGTQTGPVFARPTFTSAMTTDTEADRRHLVTYLTQNGTTPGKALRDALGWSSERFWKAAYGPVASHRFVLRTDGWAAVRHEHEHAEAA